MKLLIKNIFILTLLSAGTLVSTNAMAVANSKVSGSKHDFSINASTAFQNKDGNQSQVCIFCHTPHNAGQNKLLWNKAGDGDTNFRLYTSSSTLSQFTKESVLTASSPSILCLSCHDGKTAMNVMHTSGTGILASAAGLTGYPAGARLVSDSYALGQFMYNTPASALNGWVAQTPNLGGTTTGGNDLTNDHPIGFSYSDVLTDAPHAQTLNSFAQVGVISSDRIRFYGAKKTVECSSCHDPHIDDAAVNQKPFLVMENTGSKLCLSCHNK